MPKMTKRLSSITTQRVATPTSPELARNFMNFRFNHLAQRNTMPGRLGAGSDQNVSWGPCNSGGTDATSANARTGQALGGGGMVYQDAGVTKVNEE